MFDLVTIWSSLWLPGDAPEFNYSSFRIRNFRGVVDAEISLKRANLALLLGLNESGKTSLLKAIEFFDFRNDPVLEGKASFFKGMRNKQDVDSDQTVELTAVFEIKKSGDAARIRRKALEKAGAAERTAVEQFMDMAEKGHSFSITRCIEFKNGVYDRDYYRLDGVDLEADTQVTEDLARSIVGLSPFVIYFEDFKDRIPEKIYISPKREGYDADWADIIDGLFYHTNPSYSVAKLQKFHTDGRYSQDDADTVMQRVNRTLDKVFTEKWKQLSGVKDIDSAKLTYSHHAQNKNRYFEIKIVDSDGTTFSVDERSKGALWYLSFLMKTEFRRKKLRGESGKPIFLIDEPASNLHSSAQQNMVEDFKKLTEDTSVIYTTHSRYLISVDNVANTYIVQRKDGVTKCERWGDYIRGKSVETTYYQPLLDAINVIPNSFDVPWDRAVLTEGPSDANVLCVLFSAIQDADLDFVVYPGTAAKSLDTLISLNIGWGAKFRILLDGDAEGDEAAERYRERFCLEEESVVRLPKGDVIEDLLSAEEMMALGKIVGIEAPGRALSKKEFAAIFAALRQERGRRDLVRSCLSQETLTSFSALLERLRPE